MLTTTPRFRPCVGATAEPGERSSPSGSTSATTAITLAVPMSRPTTRSLYSLAMSLLCPISCLAVGGVDRRRDAAQAHRVAVGVAQVGVLERRAGSAPVTCAHACATKRCGAREHLVVAAAAELDRRRRCRARRATSRGPTARASSMRASSGANSGASAPVHRQHLRRAAVGPAQRGRASSSTSPTLASNTSPKLLTSLLGAGLVAPERDRPVLLELHRAGGSARRAARPPGAPRAPTRRRARAARRSTREEVAGQLRRGVGADRRRRCCA